MIYRFLSTIFIYFIGLGQSLTTVYQRTINISTGFNWKHLICLISWLFFLTISMLHVLIIVSFKLYLKPLKPSASMKSGLVECRYIQYFIYHAIPGSWDSALQETRKSPSLLDCAAKCQRKEESNSLCNAFRYLSQSKYCYLSKVRLSPSGSHGLHIL